MKITINRMSQKHLEEVALLESESFSEPWTKEAFANTLTDDNYIYLVALDKDVLAGYAGCIVSLDEADVTNIAVKKDFTNMGIGSFLLSLLQQEARAKGVKKMYLEVRKSNENAIHMYCRNGFESMGIRKNFYRKPNEDAIVMVKNIEISDEESV